MAQHHLLGKQGEEMALVFLEEKGFRVIEKNWRYRKAEVDLIATDGQTLVIIEVKTRSTDYFGAPEESINKTKQKLLCEAANAYIELKELKNEVRFDIVSIVTDGNQTRLHHIRDAFYPYSSELDG
jgi:putative endonuclease